MAVSGVNGSNGNQNLSAADLKTIEELEKEIKEDKERLKGLKKNREDMVEGSSRDNVDKAIKDLEKTIKNKEERLKALKAGETPTPNGDAGKTDGFDGAGIGEEEGLKNFIEQQGDTSTYGLAKSLSSFFKKVADFFEPQALDTPTIEDKTVDADELSKRINDNAERAFTIAENAEKQEAIAKLKAEIDKNVPNGTLEEKQTYILNQINMLDSKITSPGALASKSDSISLRSSYIEIYNENAKELGTDEFGAIKMADVSSLKSILDNMETVDPDELNKRINDNIERDFSVVEDNTTVDADELNKRINDNIERDFSIATDDIAKIAKFEEEIGNLKSELSGRGSGLGYLKFRLSNAEANYAKATDETKKAEYQKEIDTLKADIERLETEQLKTQAKLEAKEKEYAEYNRNLAQSNVNNNNDSVGTYIDITPEERAELDKMNEGSNNIIEYAKLTDQELYSKMNEINSQRAGLESEAEELSNRYVNKEITISEYNAQLDVIEEKDYALLEELMNVQSAITYKKEEKVIETMTDSQKAELESLNNKMTALQEQACVASQRMIDLATKAVELNTAVRKGEITPEEYDAEMDKIDAQDKELQSAIDSIMKELEPLQAQRDEIFANAGKSDVTNFTEISDNERAYLDKVNSEIEAIVSKYSGMSDEEIDADMRSVTDDIGKQRQSLDAERNELDKKYQNGEITLSEFNSALKDIEDKHTALDIKVIQYIVAVNEEKLGDQDVIQLMTDSQKAELEALNEKIKNITDQIIVGTLRKKELSDKSFELRDSYVNNEITEEQFKVENEKLDTQYEINYANRTTKNELTELLRQREDLFDAVKSTPANDTAFTVGNDVPVSTPKRDILTDINTVNNFDNDQKTISNNDDKVRNSEYYSVKDELSQLDSELEDLEKELSILSDRNKFLSAQMSEKIKNAGNAIKGADSGYYSKMTSEDRKNRISELKEKIAEKKAKLQAKKEKLAELRQEKELKNQALSEKLDNEISNADKVENSNSTNGIDAESKQQINDFLEDKVATYEEKVKEEKVKIADLEKTLKTLEEKKEKQTLAMSNIINASSAMTTSMQNTLTLINAQIQTSTNELNTIYESYDEDFAMLLNFKSELASLKSGTMSQDDAEKLLDVIKADDNVKEASDKGATVTPITSDLTDDIKPFVVDDKSGDGLIPKKYLKDQEFKLI